MLGCFCCKRHRKAICGTPGNTAVAFTLAHVAFISFLGRNRSVVKGGGMGVLVQLLRCLQGFWARYLGGYLQIQFSTTSRFSSLAEHP